MLWLSLSGVVTCLLLHHQITLNDSLIISKHNSKLWIDLFVSSFIFPSFPNSHYSHYFIFILLTFPEKINKQLSVYLLSKLHNMHCMKKLNGDQIKIQMYFSAPLIFLEFYGKYFFLLPLKAQNHD